MKYGLILFQFQSSIKENILLKINQNMTTNVKSKTNMVFNLLKFNKLISTN